MRARKGFTLFIPNEDINDINKIMKSLEYSGVLIDGDTETVKNEMKNTNSACGIVATSHFGLTLVDTSRTMLRPHHNVATCT